MASFFRQFNAIGPLFCHLFNIINLNYGRPKHTRNARTSSKTKPSTSGNIGPPPFGVFHSDLFRHYATFLNFFLPFVCFDILQHNGCQKIPKGPPFTFFGTVTLFKKLILNFFRKFFNISQGSLYFFIFCNQLDFHKV